MIRLALWLYLAWSLCVGLFMGVGADTSTYPELLHAIGKIVVHPRSDAGDVLAFVLCAIPAAVGWLVPASGFGAYAIGNIIMYVVGGVLVFAGGLAWLSFALVPGYLTFLSTASIRDR